MEAVKKLTPMPVNLLIDTEPHHDHTTGHFVFSPPATIVAAAGAGIDARRERQTRIGWQGSPPLTGHENRAGGLQVHYAACRIQRQDDFDVGGRTFELMYMKDVHSEADTAVWLPNERVLFSASAFVSGKSTFSVRSSTFPTSSPPVK